MTFNVLGGRKELSPDHTMTMACIFYEMIAGRAPEDIFHDDALTIAAIDLRQHNPGHVLVIPKAHISDLRYREKRTGSAVMSTLVRIARAVPRRLAGSCCASTPA